jgi:integrase
MRDAVRWGRLAVSPAAAADPPKLKEKRRDLPAWSAEQLAAFLRHVRNDRLSALWRLLAMTGCRRGEALGLRWEDVDMAAGVIAIRQTLVPVDGKVCVSDPKTASGRRTIALDPVTLEALKDHAARQADEQSEWGAAWTDSGYVFMREDGHELDPHQISKEFQRQLAAAALPRIPLHGLRHTYATLALSSGTNPRIVSGRLGHSTVALTLDRTCCRSRTRRRRIESPR